MGSKNRFPFDGERGKYEHSDEEFFKQFEDEFIVNSTFPDRESQDANSDLPDVSGRVARLHAKKEKKGFSGISEWKKEMGKRFSELKNGGKMSGNRRKATGKRVSTRKSKQHGLGKKIFKYGIYALIALVLILVVYSAFVIIRAPRIDTENLSAMLAENSVLYDDKEAEIETVFGADAGLRTTVKYEEMPEDLINAVVAIEDKTFWKHNGFNIIRMFGAVKDTIVHGERLGGTSTITQQLARNLYLRDDMSKRTLKRKITEAYYTVILERKLSKEEIIEAYLNTISLGFNAFGVQAASQGYFSKDVGELDLTECAALASLPKAPNTYALVKRFYTADVHEDNENILKRDGDFTYVYNGEASKNRRDRTLKNMYDYEFIGKAEMDKALADDLKSHVVPNITNFMGKSSYFSDYVIQEVIKDLMEEYSESEQEATQRVYSGGLQIYTTMSSQAQQAVDEAFENEANFPKVAHINKDASGNVLGDKGRILLYDYNTYFDSDQAFTIHPDEYTVKAGGDVCLKKEKRLNFYNVTVNGKPDVSLEFKDMYVVENGVFHIINGGYISIPEQYKKKDGDGNLIISKAYFDEKSDLVSMTDRGIRFGVDGFTLRQKVVQPQSAMVVLDNKNGQIRAMRGGRNTVGRMLYNRSTGPRQPGSSIKPLSIYGPALQSGYEALESGKEQVFKHQKAGDFYGQYWTAASIINDAPLTYNGKVWPKNWYSGNRGRHTLRKSVEQSVNVNAVKIFQELGAERSSKTLRDLGITTLIDSGETNDLNASALALGGMSKGISPLEMAAAYAVFPNEGKYVEPSCYTKVLNRNGEVLLEKAPKSKQVFDAGVAFIMNDILRSTVSEGIASAAAMGTQPVAGKTGTTNDQYDIWFVGNTPQYSAAIWIGNDVNLELSQGSASAARLWANTMKNVCKGLPTGSFPKAPSNVTSMTVDAYGGNQVDENAELAGVPTRTEYFISGTQPKGGPPTEIHEVNICLDTGFLATPGCPNSGKAFASAAEAPKFYCPVHNPNPDRYPVDPAGNSSYTWSGREKATPNKPDSSGGLNPSTGDSGTGSGGVTDPGTNDGSSGGGEDPPWI